MLIMLWPCYESSLDAAVSRRDNVRKYQSSGPSTGAGHRSPTEQETGREEVGSLAGNSCRLLANQVQVARPVDVS